jgi:hypothetical protein
VYDCHHKVAIAALAQLVRTPRSRDSKIQPPNCVLQDSC